MINLFRKKRNENLNQGKTKSYIKYAIGEIVLVVVGILIAIGFNDYNTRKNEKNIIAKKLKSLRQEVYLDSLEINNLINLYDNQTKLGHLLVSQINNPNEVLDCKQFIVNIHKLEELLTTLNKKSTYNEMLNEGLFSKIKDENLKQKINSFYKYHATFERASWEYLKDIGGVRNYLVNNNIILLKYHQKKLDSNLDLCSYREHITSNLKNKLAFENYIYRLMEIREIIKEFYITLNNFFIQGIPLKPEK